MPARMLTVDEIMAILPETPRQIAALTEGLSATQLHAIPEPDAWSVNDVLAHLRACHDVLGGNILRIIERGPPELPARESPRLDQEDRLPGLGVRAGLSPHSRSSEPSCSPFSSRSRPRTGSGRRR